MKRFHLCPSPRPSQNLHPFASAVDSENTNSPLKTGECLIQLGVHHRMASPRIVVAEHHYSECTLSIFEQRRKWKKEVQKLERACGNKEGEAHLEKRYKLHHKFLALLPGEFISTEMTVGSSCFENRLVESQLADDTAGAKIEVLVDDVHLLLGNQQVNLTLSFIWRDEFLAAILQF